MIKLRRAGEADREDLFSWINDEQTRKVSFSSNPVSYEEHCDWFEKSLRNPNRIIYIGESEADNKIGVVRLDKLNEYAAEFSINLSPAMRGKGYGAELIDRACEEASLNLFLARTKKENIASIKVFKKARFLEILSYEDKNYGEILLLGRIK